MKKFAKNGFIGSVTPIIKKSFPYQLPKIAFKMIYRRFTFRRASDAPPARNRVKEIYYFLIN